MNKSIDVLLHEKCIQSSLVFDRKSKVFGSEAGEERERKGKDSTGY